MSETPPSQAPAASDQDSDIESLLTYLGKHTGIAHDELNEMLAAVQRGETFYEFMGATVGVLAAIENAAVTFYSSHRYQDAENIFRLLAILTSGERASAFRGIAACRQVALDYEGAIANYVQALSLDASDLISAVYLGECLLITDQDEPAWQLLTSVLEDAKRTGQLKEGHIKRATALLAARDAQASDQRANSSTTNKQSLAPKLTEAAMANPASRSGTFGPSSKSSAIHNTRTATTGPGTAAALPTSTPSSTKVEATAKAHASSEAFAGAQNHDDEDIDDALVSAEEVYVSEYDLELPPEPRSADPEVVAFLERPHVRERLDQLSEMYRSQAITLRDIADFSQEQIDAGYAVCYTLLEQGKYARCLETCGWMLHIDSHDARFYQLAGLSALNIGLYCLAEFLFTSDTIWRQGGPDAATLVYKGESLIKQEEYAEGLQLVSEGLKLAVGKKGYGEIVKRGQLLQTHYGHAQPSEK